MRPLTVEKWVTGPWWQLERLESCNVPNVHFLKGITVNFLPFNSNIRKKSSPVNVLAMKQFKKRVQKPAPAIGKSTNTSWRLLLAL